MSNYLDQYINAYQGNLQYDFDNEILLNWYPNRILLHAKNAKSILELGLGHGYTTNLFSNHYGNHIAIDGSKAVIANFIKNYPKCKAKITETLFEDYTTDKKFDLIVMGFILEHVEDPILVLKKYEKYLNPNGQLFIAVPNAEVLNRRLGHLAGMLPNIKELSEHDYLLGHKRYYTTQTLSEDINNAGFYIERLEGIYLKPFTTKQMISLNFDKTIIDALCQIGIGYPELSCGILAELKLKR